MTQEQAITLATEHKVITVPDEIYQVRETWLKSKEQELQQAEAAVGQLETLGATPRKIKRVKDRVSLLRGVVKALQAGYIPIPRFYAEKLRLEREDLPLKALVALNQAQTQKLFDEIRFVAGQEGMNQRGRYGRRPQRDPLIVGVVRTPSRDWTDEQGRFLGSDAALEEHFLIAWWRPEDLGPEELY